MSDLDEPSEQQLALEEEKSEQPIGPRTIDIESHDLSNSDHGKEDLKLFRQQTIGKLDEIQAILQPLQDLDPTGNILDALAIKLCTHRKFQEFYARRLDLVDFRKKCLEKNDYEKHKNAMGTQLSNIKKRLGEVDLSMRENIQQAHKFKEILDLSAS